MIRPLPILLCSVLLLQGCDYPLPTQAATSTPASHHTKSLPSPSNTIPSTPIPAIPSLASSPTTVATAPLTFTPDSSQDIIPEPTVISYPVIIPTTPLDPKSYLSVLDWIKYSFAHQDLSIIRSLSLERTQFGISEAEYTSSLTKDELISTLEEHLAGGTQCLAYTYREGVIDALEVFMANWEPDWEYGGRDTNDLIFYFSDQFTPELGLSLVAVAVPHRIDQYYIDEIFEHMCFEEST